LSDGLDECSRLRNWLLVRFRRDRLLIGVSRLSSGLRWLGCGKVPGGWPTAPMLLTRLDCSGRRLSNRRLGRGKFGRPATPVLLTRWLFLLPRWLLLLAWRLVLLSRRLVLLAWWLELLSRRLMLLARSGGRISGFTAPVLLTRWLVLLSRWLFLLPRSGGRIGGPAAPVSGVFGIRPVILRPSIGLLVGRPLVRLGVIASLVVRRFIWFLRLGLSTSKK
jgi:hypothetical protein